MMWHGTIDNIRLRMRLVLGPTSLTLHRAPAAVGAINQRAAQLSAQPLRCRIRLILFQGLHAEKLCPVTPVCVCAGPCEPSHLKAGLSNTCIPYLCNVFSLAQLCFDIACHDLALFPQLRGTRCGVPVTATCPQSKICVV